MKSDRLCSRTRSREVTGTEGDGDIRQIVEKISDCRLSAVLDIFSGIAAHCHDLLSRERRNTRTGDDNLLCLAFGVGVFLSRFGSGRRFVLRRGAGLYKL